MFSAFFRDLRTEFAGYNADKLLKDVMAGLTVCAVALPLALAFGVSSGASAAAGLVTAILAGIVIAILGGASYQVSGPTGAMSACSSASSRSTGCRASSSPALPPAYCCSPRDF